jgi:Leucine-rich repeat (LRR) protein
VVPLQSRSFPRKRTCGAALQTIKQSKPEENFKRIDKTMCQTRRPAVRLLMWSLLLVSSFVHRTDQLKVAAIGCTVYFDQLNAKSLTCNNVTVASVNRDFFGNASDVIYKEIVCKDMVKSDDYLNVINEHQTEILKLIESSTTDLQLQKIFHKKSFSRLRVLDVSGNNVQTLERDTFRKSVSLRQLNLAHNSIAQLHGDVFEDLQELNELNLSDNKLIDFEKAVNVFGSLHLLAWLDLSNNSINNIERRLFQGLDALVHINMSHNKLYILPYQVFESMQSIEVVDLSHNILISFLDSFFIHNRKLRVLQLHHNLIGRINKNSLYGLKELHSLDLSYNQLQTVDRNAFDTLDGLEILNLSNNHINRLSPSVFLSLKQLKSLDLSNNLIDQLPIGIFAHQFQLEELMMDNTNLTKLGNWISKTNTNETINKNILKNLKRVSLRNNTQLDDAESCFFQNMPNMERLVITRSQLTYLPKGIDEMPKLIELDLSDNRLIFIPAGIKHLSDLNSLNLLGNDLQCDCHMYWMLNWIDELKVKNKTLPSELLRLSELKCRNGYPGDIIRVLQHINCVKPHLIYVTKEQTYALFTDAILECSFAGTPAPEIVWRTPNGEILRLDEGKVDKKAKFQLEQIHESVLKDTPANVKYQQILDSAMKSDNSSLRHGPGITLLENGRLMVHNISRLDGGLFTCYAVNIMGDATSDVR